MSIVLGTYLQALKSAREIDTANYFKLLLLLSPNGRDEEVVARVVS